MHDLVGRNRLAHNAAARVEDQHAARVVAEQPVRDAASHLIELDALHHMAVDQAHRAGLIEEIGFEHLKLKRNTQAGVRGSRPETDNRFSRFRHGADGQRLHAIEIEALRRVAAVGEERPLGIDDLVDGRVAGLRFRDDTSPNDIPG